MIHSKILSIYNELELFVQNLFHGITQIYFRHHSPELLYSVGSHIFLEYNPNYHHLLSKYKHLHFPNPL